MTQRQHIRVSERGDISVVSFEERRIIDELVILELGQELIDLVEKEDRRKLVLDFEHVEFLSSAALGRLIILEKKAKGVGAAIKLSGIRPEIFTAFSLTNLDKRFDIRENLDDAIDAFAKES
jgi:anti-sigma B factor antagonist